jgi:hypothetical protein
MICSGTGTAAFLYLTNNAGTSKASQAFWSVEDVDREIAQLKCGVVFERYTTCRASAAPKAPSSRRCQGRLVQGLRRQHPGDCPDSVTVREVDRSPYVRRC